jgi:hypothetical protein
LGRKFRRFEWPGNFGNRSQFNRLLVRSIEDRLTKRRFNELTLGAGRVGNENGTSAEVSLSLAFSLDLRLAEGVAGLGEGILGPPSPWKLLMESGSRVGQSSRAAETTYAAALGQREETRRIFN